MEKSSFKPVWFDYHGPLRDMVEAKWRLGVLAQRIADFERRHPHRTAQAERARRARLLDIDLDRMARAEVARDRLRALGGVLAWLRGPVALTAWRRRRYVAQRAARRAFVDLWLARRPL